MFLSSPSFTPQLPHIPLPIPLILLSLFSLLCFYCHYDISSASLIIIFFSLLLSSFSHPLLYFRVAHISIHLVLLVLFFLHLLLLLCHHHSSSVLVSPTLHPSLASPLTFWSCLNHTSSRPFTFLTPHCMLASTTRTLHPPSRSEPPPKPAKPNADTHICSSR